MSHPSSILMQGQNCITKPDDWRIAMTTHSLSALWSRVAGPVRILTRIRHMNDVIRSRRALRRLDDHTLRDIGLTRPEAEAEAKRARWDAPQHWNR
jgi:uncharacterized protein YjiS (DUF1127 family)